MYLTNKVILYYKPLKDFKTMAKNRAVSKKTIVFNNLVQNKAEYLEFHVGFFVSSKLKV